MSGVGWNFVFVMSSLTNDERVQNRRQRQIVSVISQIEKFSANLVVVIMNYAHRYQANVSEKRQKGVDSFLKVP